jgi:hypothetical protein
MTVVVRSLLFLSSLSPVSAILGLRLLSDHADRALALLVVAAATAALGVLMADLLGREGKEIVTVAERSARDEVPAAYLAGYLLPFLVANPSDSSSVTGLVAFLIILAWLYIAGSLVYLNPTLTLLGFHLFEVQGNAGSTHVSFMLLMRSSIVQSGDRLCATASGAVRIGRVLQEGERCG